MPVTECLECRAGRGGRACSMFCGHLHGAVTGDDDKPGKSLGLFGNHIFIRVQKQSVFFVSKLE